MQMARTLASTASRARGAWSASFVVSAASPAQFPRDGLPEVAFLGRSNVGKSSLLYALAGRRDLARVSSTPGRTRLVNFFRLSRDGHVLYLVDLPGYGYAKVPRQEREGWERLVLSYLEDREPLALCVFLVDARHESLAADTMLADFLGEQGLPHVVAATKADKLGRGARREAEGRLADGLARGAEAALAVSARTGDGLDALWARIRAAVSR
jgi:GTP-binding protein